MLAGLLSYLNAQGQGQREAYLAQLAQDDHQKALIEEQRRFDLQHSNDEAQTERDKWRFGREQAAAADADRVKGLKPPQDVAHPRNFGKPFSNEQRAQNELALAQWFSDQGDTVRAAEHRDNASRYTTLAQNDTRADLGFGKLDLDATKDANLQRYRSDVLSQRNAQFNANQRRLASQYASSYRQRGETANMNHADRLYVAQLAGQVRMTVADDNEAMRQAIAIYQQTNANYRQAMSPKAQALSGDGTASNMAPPQFQQPQPQAAPNFTINLPPYPGGNSVSTTPGAQPPNRNGTATPWKPNASSRNTQNQNANSAPPPNLSPVGRAEYDKAKEIIAQGAPLAAVLARIRQQGPSEGLSAAEVEAIVAALSGKRPSQSQPPQPTSTPAGLELQVPGISGPRTPFPSYGRGSSAGNPFPGS